jgi:hypothetical protein
LATKKSVDVVLPAFDKVEVPILKDALEKVPPIYIFPDASVASQDAFSAPAPPAEAAHVAVPELLYFAINKSSEPELVRVAEPKLIEDVAKEPAIRMSPFMSVVTVSPLSFPAPPVDTAHTGLPVELHLRRKISSVVVPVLLIMEVPKVNGALLNPPVM